jgi:hypothetical protein
MRKVESYAIIVGQMDRADRMETEGKSKAEKSDVWVGECISRGLTITACDSKGFDCISLELSRPECTDILFSRADLL